MQEYYDWNDEWLYSEVFKDSMINTSYAEDDMEKVRIPHTNVEMEYNGCNEQKYQGVCCYRKHFVPLESWKGQVVTLTFMGAAHWAKVYINGKFAGEHKSGYTAFTLDITEYLMFGRDNVVTVELDSRETMNVPPFGKVIDYMTYGGLYREVYLEVRNNIALTDLFVQTISLEQKKAELLLNMEVSESISGLHGEIYIREKNEKGNGKEILRQQVEIKEVNTNVHISLADVKPWSINDPQLYEMKVFLYHDDELLHEKNIIFGIRTAVFQKDGFYLNGEKIKIQGLDRHQSYPYVGYAMPASMQIMDADILKNELCLNAVRTSHYPQSQHFIDHCDEIGLLVFTEMPGWQHIGDAEWKKQAVENVKEMVLQYRNHPSIILWGVRINESMDDDEFYKETNAMAHKLDPSRQTGGVRNFGGSHLFEDVYTYNDFVHDGTNQGVDQKKKITSDMEKPYLVSEYNGHMFPTKAFDCESHRTEHALRHAKVLNDVNGEPDISGSFGWCMFDYNTHRDFGSGDRICYHGVMDMFRNPKMAAAVYESQGEKKPFLEVSSNMDIGEYPACNIGSIYAFTNADSVKLYKNGTFIREFFAKDSEYPNLKHGPIIIDDFIGNLLVEKEGFSESKAKAVKKLLLDAAKYGMNNLPLKTKLLAARLMTFHGMKLEDGVELYGKYIGNWGGFVTTYRFEAIKDGNAVKELIKTPAESYHLSVKTDHKKLVDGVTYDVAAIRMELKDQNGNMQPYMQIPVKIIVEGPAELIGPSVITLQGGMGGTYIKTTRKAGKVTVRLEGAQFETEEISFDVTVQ